MHPYPTPDAGKPLSPRMLEVIGLLAQGMTIREAAQVMKITKNTARNLAIRSYERLGARSKTEAVVKAIRTGLVQL